MCEFGALGNLDATAIVYPDNRKNWVVIDEMERLHSLPSSGSRREELCASSMIMPSIQLPLCSELLLSEVYYTIKWDSQHT